MPSDVDYRTAATGTGHGGQFRRFPSRDTSIPIHIHSQGSLGTETGRSSQCGQELMIVDLEGGLFLHSFATNVM